MPANSRTFQTRVTAAGTSCVLPLPFAPADVFGKARAPVVVIMNGYTYRSTVALMGGPPFVPLRRSHREAAGIEVGDLVEVTLALDTEPREVETPDDLAAALRDVPEAQARWDALSYTHRREHVEAIESAKKPETRARRVAAAIDALAAAPGRHSAPAARRSDARNRRP